LVKNEEHPNSRLDFRLSVYLFANEAEASIFSTIFRNYDFLIRTHWNKMATLGFIGLGGMGSRIVKRLLDAGHTVTGYNRTRAKAQWLIDAGMQWGDSPRAVAEAADITLSMVTNTAALQTIAEGPDGVLAGLAPGKIFIDMSTVSPAASRTLAEKVAALGAQMVDAPVSGSLITLEQGKLSIMVGGTPEAFEKVKPILLDIGPRVTHMGGNGLAASMKIASNLSLAVQMLAFSEGVLLAEKSGIKREVAVDFLTHSVIGSPMVQYRGPFVLNMPEEAWFDVNMMQKDMLLALEMGRQLDVPLPTTAVTNEFLTAARGLGLADKDFAVIFQVLAKLAGVDV
jgi:3-hydroxyisobutyrate dehydrogenase-like beta-hydroxyacid dehydrogenase